MTLRFRAVLTGVTLTAIIGLIGLSEDADACPRRCRLFSGGLFAGRKCASAASEPIAPEKSPPIVVEPTKEPPPPAVKKDLPAIVKTMADLFKKGDTDSARKLAAATSKDPMLIDEITDLMHLYRPTNKGGLGIETALKKANGKN